MMPAQSKLDNAVTGQQDEYVLVPRNPTPEMLAAGWYEAHEENARGVWDDMIEAWESSAKHGKLVKR